MISPLVPSSLMFIRIQPAATPSAKPLISMRCTGKRRKKLPAELLCSKITSNRKGERSHLGRALNIPSGNGRLRYLSTVQILHAKRGSSVV